MATINCTSVCNKTDQIIDLISDQEIDLLIITESWIRNNETDISVLNAITPCKYKLFSLPRKHKRGGGIIIIYRDYIEPVFTDFSNVRTSESLNCKFKVNNQKINLLAIYHPPSLYYRPFVEELNSFLCEQQLNHEEVCFVIGDLNIKMDLPDDYATKLLNNALRETGFCQLVEFPTHVTRTSKHIIDLVITNEKNLVTGLYPTANVSSFHKTVVITTNLCNVTKHSDEVLNLRQWKNFNHDEFLQCLDHQFQRKSLLNVYNVDNLLDIYNETITSVLDRLAPFKTIKRKNRKTPFFDDELYDKKRDRRKKERKYQKSKTDTDWNSYKMVCKEYSDLVIQKKIDFYKNKLENTDMKALFKTCNNLMSTTNMKTKLPQETDEPVLAEKFNIFFTEKIESIRENIPVVPIPTRTYTQNENTQNNIPVERFKLVTEPDLLKILNVLSNKSSLLDPLPTWLLKKHVSFFLPILKHIVNASFCAQTVPDAIKQSIVFPALKKNTLDNEILNNYRPVSNIPFLSKVMEKIVDEQITRHLTENNFDEIFQSGFKKAHSCETALLKILNDVYLAKERKKFTVLILIDLSAAFDTIDHSILFNLLENKLKIQNGALNWLKSFLTNRKQCTRIGNSNSPKTEIRYGVPQGTILGPKIFSLYMLPLYEIFKCRNVRFHSYADDTQFYLETSNEDIETTKTEIKTIIETLKHWLDMNKLKMNPEKTELIVLGSNEKLTIEIDNKTITSSKNTKNLGVIFDQKLSFESHINKVCSQCYFHLRNISRNRKYMTENTCKIVINSLVLSKISFCSMLLVGLPNKQIEKLQKVQNYAAKLITMSRKFDHVSPLLKRLDWIPISKFIKYRFCTLIFKCLNYTAPIYLSALVNLYIPNRNLRSSNLGLLFIPNIKTELGRRSFSYLAPKLWNDIPIEIRNTNSFWSFKRKLKTYYLNQN